MSEFVPAHTRFRFCPHCGSDQTQAEVRTFDCGRCGFHLHFNATVSASALVVRDDGKVLLIRRARPPAQGALALPGGFVDPWERAEVALVRELSEEVGLAVYDIQFLGSWPNAYCYKNLGYPVCDLFFVVRPSPGSLTLAEAEATEAIWLDPETVSLHELAFASMRSAVAFYRGEKEEA